MCQEVKKTEEDHEALLNTDYKAAEVLGYTSKLNGGVQVTGEDDVALISEEYEISEGMGNTSQMDEEVQVTGKDDQSDCEDTEKSKNTLKTTNVSVINAFKKFKSYPDNCRIEGKTFSMEKLKELLRPMYHCTEDGIFRCNYCDKSTHQGNHMMEHSQVHVESLEFDCVECGHIFKRTATYRGHKRTFNKDFSLSRCYQNQLKNQDAGSSDKYGCNDFDSDDGGATEQSLRVQKVKYPLDLRNIIIQTIGSMEKGKKNLKRLGFSKNVIEPLLKAEILKFKASSQIDLARSWRRKIQMLREEIKHNQEKFPGEEVKHIVSETWGLGDLRVEISQGIQKIEKLDKENKVKQSSKEVELFCTSKP